MSSEAPELTALRELRRADRLGAEYLTVGRLLSSLPWAQRARVGTWLGRLDAEALSNEHPSVAVLRIAITGNATVGPAAPHLLANAAIHGMAFDVYIGDQGQYRQDLIDPDSDLYDFEARVTCCALDAEAIAAELPQPWGAEDADVVLERRLAELEELAGAFETIGESILVVNTIPLPRHLSHRLVDHRSRARLGASWRRFNADVLELMDRHDRVVIVDLEASAADVALEADPRLATHAHQHLPEGALARLAEEITHIARGLVGKQRKCLVLDLDETIWGGSLAELGPAGIEAGGFGRGAAFASFQRTIKQLASQGVLLAVCSKNDDVEVRRALREHPDLELREDDFATIRAGWRPKSESLAELAVALNLGTDSLVFIDDSAFERELVAATHPEAAVVAAHEDPALNSPALLDGGWFTVRGLTREDRRRPRTYRAQADRRTFLDGSASIEDFLRGLEIKVRIVPAAEHEVARVAQLTLRTNQFNLTTERLQEADLARRLADPAFRILAIHVSDRFGDDGLVGSVLARREGESLLLENFVLSCRVFSRGIESATLAELLRAARADSLREVVGFFRPGPRNAKVRELYPMHGFRTLGVRAGVTRFVHDLTKLPSVPDHLVVVAEIEALAA